MSNWKLFLLLLLSVSSCYYQPYYSESFLDRFTNQAVSSGNLFVPVGNDEFIVIENAIVYARLYHEYFENQYSSYGAFLNSLMNSPGLIDIKGTMGLPPTYKYNHSLQMREANERFFRKFMTIDGQGQYKVKEQYRTIEANIASVCFDAGYYVYTDCYWGRLIISKDPLFSPPPPLNDN